MKRIETIIQNNLKTELNWGTLLLGKNDKALYLKFGPHAGSNTKRSIDAMIKKLPPNTGIYYDEKIQIVFAPIETPEQKLSFAEAKACVVGQKMVKHQEQTLVLMAQYKDALQEMVEMKREVKSQTQEAIAA